MLQFLNADFPKLQTPPRMTGSEASLDSRPQIEHRAKTRPLWSGGEQLFVTLRHRLDQMEYSEFLAKDSVDLVQRLLADLVQTTETARSFKALLETATNDRILAEEQVGPLRVEIGRLSSENNTLHRYANLDPASSFRIQTRQISTTGTPSSIPACWRHRPLTCAFYQHSMPIRSKSKRNGPIPLRTRSKMYSHALGWFMTSSLQPSKEPKRFSRDCRRLTLRLAWSRL